jgi:hypothetical protein
MPVLDAIPFDDRLEPEVQYKVALQEAHDLQEVVGAPTVGARLGAVGLSGATLDALESRPTRRGRFSRSGWSSATAASRTRSATARRGRPLVAIAEGDGVADLCQGDDPLRSRGIDRIGSV